ncbi:MAG: hypothetical protein KY445_13745 [Armatimonadetes bacterium]|nr:hypothetical protein [Armatimonadota bacterium]
MKELAADFSQRMLVDHQWKGDLNAFNDILRGSGMPEDGFLWRWKNSKLSRERTGSEFVRHSSRNNRVHGEAGEEAYEKVELELTFSPRTSPI